MAIIGKVNTLTVVRNSNPGIYLDGGPHGEILLPNRYVPKGIEPGDRLDVFVYRDSEDRLVASTETPRATVGQVATLTVISVNQQVGAFLDWGLEKDLLLPYREQTSALQVGQRVTVRIYLDKRTERIVASMRLVGAVGVEAPNPAGYQRVGPLALRILQGLQRSGGRMPLDDDSTPEAIRKAFGASKKAFKQAVGTLYKDRRIRFSHPGIELVDNSIWSPKTDHPAP